MRPSPAFFQAHCQKKMFQDEQPMRKEKHKKWLAQTAKRLRLIGQQKLPHLYSYSLSQPHNPTIQNRRNSVISRKATLPIECRPDQSAEGIGNLFACTQKIQWPYPIRDMVHTHGMDGLLKKKVLRNSKVIASDQWMMLGWIKSKGGMILILPDARMRPWTAKNHSNTLDGEESFEYC